MQRGSSRCWLYFFSVTDRRMRSTRDMDDLSRVVVASSRSDCAEPKDLVCPVLSTLPPFHNIGCFFHIHVVSKDVLHYGTEEVVFTSSLRFF